MTGAGRRIGTLRGKAALLLVAFALLLRVMVPAGFMPAAGKGFAIELCTGMGVVPAWVDEHGGVHKGKPSPAKQPTEHPCAFAGLATALDLPDQPGTSLLPRAMVSAPIFAAVASVAIGRGLAAPPPPQTGPPASL